MNDDKEQSNECIEDLALRETETTEVKGGPASQDYILVIDGIKGESADRHHK